jgi:CheY-like chemotaxis protein
MGSPQGKTILVVDDEPYNLKPFTDALRDRGFRVIEKYSAADAQDFLNNGARVDLVVVDVLMPPSPALDDRFGSRSTGVELGRWIKGEHHLRVVGFSWGEDPDGWFERFTAGFISKKDGAPNFAREIDEILDSRGRGRSRQQR